MKQGKRFLCYTALGLCGTVLLFIGVNKLHTSAITTVSPQWLRTATSLGLRRIPEAVPSKRYQMLFTELDPASLHDFDDISITGNIKVEIIGAPEYRVQFKPAIDKPAKLMGSQNGRVLWLTEVSAIVPVNTGVTGEPATLTIEAPSLATIRATGLRQLTVRRLHGEKLTLLGCSVHETQLEQNQVAQWNVMWCDVTSATDTLKADPATHAAGSIRVRADQSYSLAGK